MYLCVLLFPLVDFVLVWRVLYDVSDPAFGVVAVFCEETWDSRSLFHRIFLGGRVLLKAGRRVRCDRHLSWIYVHESDVKKIHGNRHGSDGARIRKRRGLDFVVLLAPRCAVGSLDLNVCTPGVVCEPGKGKAGLSAGAGKGHSRST